MKTLNKIFVTSLFVVLGMACIALIAVPLFAVPSDGWNNDNTTYYQDGAALTGLQTIDGDMYYFDEETGILQTGLVKVSTNCTTEDGFIETTTATYYFNPEAQSGWYEDENKNVYYFNLGALSGFQVIEDNTYYFDAEGVLQTGWVVVNNNKYYFSTDGVMLTGFQTIEGNTCYFNKEGILQTGWVVVDDNTYYFDANEGMLTGLQVLEDNTYYFDEDGILQVGWVVIDGNTYYFDEDAGMLTGFQVIEENTYYLNEDGILQTGWIVIDDNTYYFNADGVMLTGFQTLNDNTYYFNKEGILQTGWVTVDSSKYYLDEDGIMQTGIQTIDGEIYYFSTEDGHMTKGGYIKTVGDDTYYIQSDGTALKSGSVTVSGYKYTFGSDGKMTSKTAVVTSSSGSSSSSSSSSSKSSSSSSSSSGSSSYSQIVDGVLQADSGNKTKVGKITIGSYSSTLYVENAKSTSLGQAIVDASNSALIRDIYNVNAGKSSLDIYDHSNQGLSVLWYTSVGDTATLTLCGVTVTLTCTAVYKHISDTNLPNYRKANTILIKTCESGGGSTYGNRITIWTADGLDIDTIAEAFWYNGLS